MKKCILLATALAIFLSLSGWAQDTATIVGDVTDATGAVIPGAKVTVANPDKGFTREFVANSAGAYAAERVPIGNYVITAEASGFQKLVRSGITVTVGQTQRVDLQLTLGQVTQEVTVTGNVARVETETAAISDVVTGNQISKLELNGRNFVTLALLVPGAVPDNGLSTQVVGVYANNSISFNGSRLQYNNWEIDGGNNTDEGSASTFNTYPNLDTIAEFRISTSNYGADMGKHSGATIEVATKSGTRDFHGDASEYNRNSAVSAGDFFSNRVNQPVPFLNQNEFGYTIGGPVYIPGVYNTAKNKTFFYWSEDWRRIRSTTPLGAGVPTAGMRNGDFSVCDPKLNPSGNLVITDGCLLPSLTVNGVTTTYDTITQMQTAEEALGVSSASLNQAFINGQNLLNGTIPLQNTSLLGQWYVDSPSPTNWRQEQIRVDENISDKTQVFGRWTQDAWNTLAVPALWSSAGEYDTIKTPFGGPGKSATFHVTHSFKPNLMNEFIFAYTTDHIILGNSFADSVAGTADRPSSFVMNHLFTGNDSNPLLPSMTLCAGLNFCQSEDASNHPWKNSNPIMTWKDNMAWTHGKHTTKFGLYLENYRKNEQFGFQTQGFLYFYGGGPTTLNGLPFETGNAMADMFLGAIQQYQEGTEAFNGVDVGGYNKGHWQMTDLEPYIGDDWKVTPRLTLNLGLRYYIYSRIHDVSRPTIDSGFFPAQFNPAMEDPLLANGNINTAAGLNDYEAPGNGLLICGQNGIPNGCQLANTRKNFAPRFGFAYDPIGDAKTVIRGGYGIYFESGNGNEAHTEGGEGNPPTALSPSGFNIFGYNNIVPGAIGPTGYTSIPYSQGWPYSQQYSLGVQHEFAGNNLLSVGYVGNVGRKLARARNLSELPIPVVATQNVPALAGTTGTDKTGLGLNPSCDASGVCNVQALLINDIVPSAFFQPFPDFNNITQKENTAVASYNSLQVNYRHTFSHGLTLQAVYTWSHALDNSTSTYLETSGSIDDANENRWKGTSDTNRTQVLQLNYVYDLPFFRHSSGFTKSAFGGWTVSGITSFFTGEPTDFNCGITGFSTGIGGTPRCDVIGNLKIDKTIANEPSYGPTLQWYNPGTTTQPTAAQFLADGEPNMFGNMGRNELTGPGRNNWDLAIIKTFQLPWFGGEHSNLEFRWENFNAWNHVQYQYINNGCNGNTPFGVACNSAAYGNASNGFVNSDWGPRIMQFGLKFIF